MAKTTTTKKGGAKSKAKATTSRNKTAAKAVNKPATKTVRRVQVKATAASLNIWNKTLVVLYLVQGLALLVLANAKNVTVTTTYLTPDPLASSGGELVRVNATRALFDVNLVYLLAITLIIMLVSRFVAATRYRENYEAELDQKISRIRWLELGFGGGLMVVIVALVSGVSDLGSLVMLFVLTEIAAFSALLLEEKVNSAANYAVGLKGLLLPWLVVAGTLMASSVYGHANTPAFVYWIFGTMAVAFSVLLVNAYLIARQKGKWVDYLYGEKVYLGLSFAAITLLTWQVFAGLLS